MSRYRTRSGIVLRRHVTPDGDVLLRILAPDGKVAAVARSGAKGPRSPKLNLFQHITFQTYERPGSDLVTLTQVSLEGALPGLSSPERYPYAHLIAELADQLWQENDRVGQAGFELLSGALRGLVRHHDPDRVALVMAWKLLGFSGLFPRLGACVETGATDDLTHFDPVAGGALRGGIGRGIPVGEDALEELGFIGRSTVREVLDGDVPEHARAGLWRALEAYTRAHVGELKAWEAIRSLRSSLAPARA
ncbi:MAG TPA: DNA repair protein RecO [Deinococcales bacterium]|nr:DNA repair protein RecO [Deinococcales bacterium]